MGIPIHSSFDDFSTVLSSHNFKNNTKKENATTNYISEQIWENGDFYTQRHCDVHLFSEDGKHIDYIWLRIPRSNFKSLEEYIVVSQELINDLSTKYGNPQIDSLGNNDCQLLKWNLSNGTLEFEINKKIVSPIKLFYQSKEIIDRHTRLKSFKGQGKSDL